jgi:hypothetical protein
MKKLLLLTAIAVLSCGTMNAQISFGAKAGLNLASLSGDDELLSELDGLTSFHVGAVANIPLGEMIGLQPEVVFSSQGASASEEGIDLKIKLTYVNIPVMVDVKLAEGFSLQGGPQIGINVGAKLDVDGETEDIDDIETIDLGVGIGAQYKLPMGVFFQARYTIGLTDLDSESNVTNSVASLSVGWFFN